MIKDSIILAVLVLVLATAFGLAGSVEYQDRMSMLGTTAEASQ